MTKQSKAVPRHGFTQFALFTAVRSRDVHCTGHWTYLIGDTLYPARPSFFMGLVFKPTSAFKWHFEVYRDTETDRQALAEVRVASIRNRAVIQVGRLEIEASARGLLRPRFTFSHDERVMATAGSTGFLRSRLWLESSGRRYEIVGRMLGHSFDVSADGSFIGTIARSGIFTRNGRIELPEEVPIHDRLFMLALVAFLWRQQAAAAS
jgi:hypothetical protein